MMIGEVFFSCFFNFSFSDARISKIYSRFLDLAKPKSGACIFFPPHVSRTQCLALARTRTQVVQLGAQCTNHWTTEQSHGIGVPAVQLTTPLAIVCHTTKSDKTAP